MKLPPEVLARLRAANLNKLDQDDASKFVNQGKVQRAKLIFRPAGVRRMHVIISHHPDISKIIMRTDIWGFPCESADTDIGVVGR